MTADKPFTPHGHPSRSSAVSRYIDLYREHCGALPTLNNQECEAIWQFVQWALSEIGYAAQAATGKAEGECQRDPRLSQPQCHVCGGWVKLVEGGVCLPCHVDDADIATLRAERDACLADLRKCEQQLIAVTPVTHTLHDARIALLRQAIFTVLDERQWDFENDEQRVDFADRVASFIPSAGLRSAESYECQIKAQHQVIAERDATIASLRSHEQRSGHMREAMKLAADTCGSWIRPKDGTGSHTADYSAACADLRAHFLALAATDRGNA
jgi:hypothetical protein